MEKAKQDRTRTQQLNNDMIQTTQSLQNTELKIGRLNEQITRLQSDIITLNTRLQTESKDFSKFIPIIERLSLYPSDTLLAAPARDPTQTTIGLSIIHNLSKQLEIQAKTLTRHKQEIHKLQDEFTIRVTQLTQLRKEQEKEQGKVTQALKQARITQRESTQTLSRISQDATSAVQKSKNLDDAIRQIHIVKLQAEKRLKAEEKLARQAHNLARMQKVQKESAMISSLNNGPGLNAKMTSKANAPVIGPVISLWGSKTETGPAQGITYAPQSQATVRSPCSGTVEFAGPFRGYGHMIILNCGKSYRFVLAGMDSLTIDTGQTIQKGIMIGKMPAWSGQGLTGRPTLFVQLRHGEKTINPSPFL